MQNILDHDEEEKPQKRNRHPIHYSILILLFIGLGMASQFFYNGLTYRGIHFSALLSLIIIIITSIVLFFRRLKKRSIKSELYFQLQLSTITLSFIIGWTIIQGGIEGYIFQQMLINIIAWWVGIAILGGIILRIINSFFKKKL